MSNKIPITNLGNWKLEIRNFLLDTLFPISCLTCGQDGVWLCDGCLEKIPLRREQVCPLCEKNITPQGQSCFACRRKYAIDGLLVSCSYQQDPISHLVHLYKYRFAEDLHQPLGQLMLKAIYNSELAIPDLVIPVPLHKKRLRWRGFNQAALLAGYLSENIAPGFPVPVLNNFLVRQKNTHPQMEIKNYSQRQKNIHDAFAINKKQLSSCHPELVSGSKKIPGQARNDKYITGKNILLVDDVATTGSTLFECARILKKAGAASVFGIVIARQEFKKEKL